MEELSVQLWRKRSLATLTSAQVISHSCEQFFNCSVDCKVEDWSSWSECSATCGGGTRTRERKVVQEPENGGAACQDREEEESCNTEPCEGNFEFNLILFQLKYSFQRRTQLDVVRCENICHPYHPSWHLLCDVPYSHYHHQISNSGTTDTNSNNDNGDDSTTTLTDSWFDLAFFFTLFR